MPKIGSLASNFDNPNSLLEGFHDWELIEMLKNRRKFSEILEMLRDPECQIYDNFQKIPEICADLQRAFEHRDAHEFSYQLSKIREMNPL